MLYTNRISEIYLDQLLFSIGQTQDKQRAELATVLGCQIESHRVTYDVTQAGPKLSTDGVAEDTPALGEKWSVS